MDFYPKLDVHQTENLIDQLKKSVEEYIETSLILQETEEEREN